jgi:hypothetical protein
MKKRKIDLFSLVSFLTIFAILTSGCDLLDTIVRALARACARTEFAVTRTDDPRGGLCSETDCSLRQAVTLSNACSGTQTIRIPAGTYALTLTGANEDNNVRGDLDITQDVNLIGVDYPALDGNSTDRVLDIKAGATVTLQTLVIQNGLAQWGGGITNAGNLIATDVLIQYNYDSIGGSAAGVFTAGTASFSHSAFYANVSFEETAGIQNEGTLRLDNVTITGNHGYGVMNDPSGTTEIIFSTIADNPGAYELWNNGPVGSFSISNSIVSGHTSDGNCFAPVQSNGFNIDSSTATSGNICSLNQPSDLNGIDPHLQAASTSAGLPIRPLAAGSPALDSADPAKCSGTDQRGVARPQGPACDRGAYERTPQEQDAAPPVISHVPTSTPEPSPTPTTAAGSSSLTVNKNANCRKGPAVNYDVVTSFVQGTALTAAGRNADNTWWNVQIPSGGNCWLSHTTVDITGSLDYLPILPALPLPDSPSAFNDSTVCDPKKSMKVTLTWTGVPNETGYRIYRNGELIVSLKANVSKYTDNAPVGHDFEYQLAAFNENGESDRVSTTVGACK